MTVPVDSLNVPAPCPGMVEKISAAIGCDGLRGGRGDDAGARFSASQGGLEIEHALEAGPVVEQRVHDFPAEKGIEQAHAPTLIIPGNGAAIEEKRGRRARTEFTRSAEVRHGPRRCARRGRGGR